MLSIIIPTLDEARIIKKTLKRLKGEYEVIIADGKSTDATRKVAEKLGARIVKAERGITSQLTAGITAAKGDVFLFLHADTTPPEGFEEQIEKGGLAGGFLHRYDRFGALPALQAAINNANARIFRRFSGEQGFFITREALNTIKGLPAAGAIETEALCERLKRAGIKPTILDGKSVSSARKLKEQGVIAFLRMNWAHALKGLGVDEYRLKKYFSRVR